MEQQDRLTCLPSLVLTRLLSLLSPDFRDVRSLSLASKDLRRRVVGDIARVYTPVLVLDTSQTAPVKLSTDKPVLCLRLVCSDSLSCCSCSPTCSSLSSCPGLASRLAAHTSVLQAVGRLDLSCLRSLEVTNKSDPDKGEAYRGLLKVLPLNPSLCCAGLEHLAVDVCLINLSEIRQAIINVVYQHNDFDNGANIDYIINSAVSQILYTLLIFLDDLYSNSKTLPLRKSRLRSLELNFQSRRVSDWGGLEPGDFSLTEAEHLRNCLLFMINEFKDRISLQYGVTDSLRITGIPSVFHHDLMELSSTAVSAACDLWPCDPHRKPFLIVAEPHSMGFDLVITFPRDSTTNSSSSSGGSHTL